MASKIIRKLRHSEGVYSLWLQAPRLAQKRKAGQFVIVRPNSDSERVPLTMVDSDMEEGSVRILFQAVGYTTMQLAALKEGEEVFSLVGPLGQPTEILHEKNVLCVGGGIGVAPLLPMARALKEANCQVSSVIGARSKELLILEDEMKAASSSLAVMTDDGSYGKKGFVTEAMEKILSKNAIDHCYVVGPIPMMKACAAVAKEYGVKATVSLNPIMIDGTGMCGGCRVAVAGQTRYACVDGPEFPAELVDFDQLRRRLSTYGEFEHACRMKAQAEGLSL